MLLSLSGCKNYGENYNVYVRDSMPMLFRVLRFLCKYCYLGGGLANLQNMSIWWDLHRYRCATVEGFVRTTAQGI